MAAGFLCQGAFIDSPFLQAKWALDHNGVKYKCTKYTPILGEGWLRRKTGKKEGLLTTPVLVCPEGMQRYL